MYIICSLERKLYFVLAIIVILAFYILAYNYISQSSQNAGIIIGNTNILHQKISISHHTEDSYVYSFIESSVNITNSNKSLIYHPICVNSHLIHNKLQCYTNIECFQSETNISKYEYHHRNPLSFLNKTMQLSVHHQHFQPQTLNNKRNSMNGLLFPYSGLIYRNANLRTKVHFLKSMANGECLISDKYKFVYIHIKKSGGTSMFGFLTWAFCETHAMNECSSYLRKTNCFRAFRRVRKYFFFTFVRNPYDRMFSLFSHLWIRRKEIKGYKHPVRNFTRIQILKDFGKFVEGRFVNIGFLSNGLSTDHYHSQTDWSFSHIGNCPLIDFIGHLEDSDNDIWRLLKLLNIQPLIKYYLKNKEFWKINVFGDSLKQHLFRGDMNGKYHLSNLTDIYNVVRSEFGVDAQDLTAKLYAKDFKFLGYSTNKIENNLQNIFEL